MEDREKVMETLKKRLVGYPNVDYEDLTDMTMNCMRDGESMKEAVNEAIEFYKDEIAELDDDEMEW